ncbi:hypothetical protein [Desulfopila sp. IMCC35006]|nr:hypothetical protein [Desulfopila sp. IMCC35006]
MITTKPQLYGYEATFSRDAMNPSLGGLTAAIQVAEQPYKGHLISLSTI